MQQATQSTQDIFVFADSFENCGALIACHARFREHGGQLLICVKRHEALSD